MDTQTHAGAHSSAWARAVAMVERRQAELEERRRELQEGAKKAERDRAFSRIWGRSRSVSQGVAADQAAHDLRINPRKTAPDLIRGWHPLSETTAERFRVTRPP